MNEDTTFETLLQQKLASKLAEKEHELAFLEVNNFLLATELEALKAVLAYDSSLKELFEEVQTKMKEGKQQ
ncbi:hypothetical protein [Streptococcus mitis]|jgi:hypothetical protein|uniref:Uncharacterized protein n=1 Tax=Streptococcus mitis TaxID=28037 RepID=A0A1X1K6A8_STRMT|nr:hypothetical protein [Streptococcus mitis]ORO94771.1 hypothetical protein B7698_05880 [Streptococcus mitis]